MGGGQVGGWVDASIKLLAQYNIIFESDFFSCSDSNEENTNLKT